MLDKPDARITDHHTRGARCAAADRKAQNMTQGFELPTHQQMVRNILKTYKQASAAQAVDGARWYSDAHALAEAITPGDVERGAAIIAALSPALAWSTNMRVAVAAARKGSRKPAGVIGANWIKAKKIANGADPDRVLSGAKVRAFAACIASDGEHPDAVCVDRHAAAIACGRFLEDGGAAAVRGKRYEMIAAAYRDAAARAGVTPAQMQAVTWVVWRETPWRKRPAA